eukprot:m.525045 g.525045  ORF g.525045 m.525045 type:complete len:680 (+) comp21998_c0_seq1:273-2312(+)
MSIAVCLVVLQVNIDHASFQSKSRLDLKDANLRHLLKRLAAADLEQRSTDIDRVIQNRASGNVSRMILRVGGSAADTAAIYPEANQTITLGEDYWDELVDFATFCGVQLAYDLNGMGMRHPNRTWDASDATRQLQHIKKMQQTDALWAFQHGNEPGHYLTRHPAVAPSAAEHGRDYVALNALLDAVFGSSNPARPKVQGPDICFGHMSDTSPCADIAYLETLLKAAGPGAIDYVTVHAYGLMGPKASRPTNKSGECFQDIFLTPIAWESNMLPTLQQWKQLQQRAAPGSKLVLTESATTGDGGCPGLSNTFVAGFFFVDELGFVAANGYWQSYRQDLVGWSGSEGSSYALAGPAGWYSEEANGALLPNPDYFTALLWRALMGPQILKVTVADTAAFRAHAACSPNGGIAVAYANSASSAATVSLRELVGGNPHGVTVVDAYILTSAGGDLKSPEVFLNGGGDPATPLNATSPILPQVMRADPQSQTFALPAFSYGFLVDRAAKLPACTQSVHAEDANNASHADQTTVASVALDTSLLKSRCLDPRDFGAKLGNSGATPVSFWKANTAAIQKAFDIAGHAADPTCVLLAGGGDYVAADLVIHGSGVQLVIDAGTRLVTAVNVTKTALLLVQNATHIEITGGGVIYGNAEYYIDYFIPGDDEYAPTSPDGGRPRLLFVRQS